MANEREDEKMIDEIARDMRELTDGIAFLLAQGAVIGIPSVLAFFSVYGWLELWGAAIIPAFAGSAVIIYLAFFPLRRAIIRRIECSDWYQRMKDRYTQKQPDDERLRGAVIEEAERENNE